MFEQYSIKGKKTLITAGASGLGLEMAGVFLEAGAQVLIADIDEQGLSAAKKQYPELHTAVCDVADEASVDLLFERTHQLLGGLDILINNAGIAGPTGYVENLAKQDWDRTLAVNITGQFLCARRAVPLLKQSPEGVMINMSSVGGHMGFAGRSAYAASKWAVVGFTKTLALELGKFGVRVNAILPGAVEGPRVDAVIAAKAKTLGQPLEQVHAQYVNNAALQRMVSARDIANMALFSASGAARSVTGQALVVDGYMQALV